MYHCFALRTDDRRVMSCAPPGQCWAAPGANVQIQERNNMSMKVYLQKLNAINSKGNVPRNSISIEMLVSELRKIINLSQQSIELDVKVNTITLNYRGGVCRSKYG